MEEEVKTKKQSEEELTTARVLEENGRYAHAVWHAQQACELSLKSLMMRTCGITDEEHTSHNLQGFVERMNGHSGCPVTHSELRKLSTAYLRARYTSQNVRGAPLPADQFGEADAREALRNAGKLRSWICGLDSVPTPSSSSGSQQRTKFVSPNTETSKLPRASDLPSMEPPDLSGPHPAKRPSRVSTGGDLDSELAAAASTALNVDDGSFEV